jgi:large subunit ribosomal protein L20
MARIKRSVHARKRRRTVLDRARGFRGARSRRYRVANESVMHAERYAYRDRRARKRDFRRLWIARITAACREHEIKYSELIFLLTKQGNQVNRKMLSELAIADPGAFGAIVEQAKAARA